ncbi:MAG: hypothetical protein HKP44_01470 [Desulfofustis sp.]|nr:hypothetical protein [Desulfofustis sp.]NNK55962.1 hypothetical protein [Desulfofustis sp.]
MRHKLCLLFTLLLGLCAFHWPVSADADDGVKFTLLFSANVNGELEPCG